MYYAFNPVNKTIKNLDLLLNKLVRERKEKTREVNNMKWVCILSPTVEMTKVFIKRLELGSHSKIKFLLSKEDEFDHQYMPLLKTAHVLELFNQFLELSREKVKPELIISDYSVDFFRTQILEHGPISYNMYSTLETFVLNIKTLLNLPSVEKYIVLNDVLSKESYYYKCEKYLTVFAKEYLLALPKSCVTFIDNNIKGLDTARNEIYLLLNS